MPNHIQAIWQRFTRRGRAGSVAIADVAEDVTQIETCTPVAAQFAGGAHGIVRDRQANPFLGWTTQAAVLRRCRLRDVVLDGASMILLKDGQVIAETIYLQPEPVVAALLADRRRLERVAIAGPVGLCFDHWPENYYHWTAHAVPALYAISQRNDPALTLALPPLRPWQLQSLERLGLADRPVLTIATDRQYRLQAVDYYDLAVGTADFAISPLSRAAYARMARDCPEARPADRIYIDRGGSANRRVPNEAELAAAFHRRGFVVLRPETLDLARQIALFRGAGMVAGLLGAGLANIAYCQPGTIVYELVPEHHRNPCFLAMALQGGLQYWADSFATGLTGEDHVAVSRRDIDVARVMRRVDELERIAAIGTVSESPAP